MAIVKVFNDGKEFDVEASANLTSTLVSTANGSHVVSLESTSYSTDQNADAGERGVVFGRGTIEMSGLGTESNNKPIKPKGVFDESKANSAGFANLLHRTLVNAVFQSEMEIEPLNLDGTVKPEYQS